MRILVVEDDPEIGKFLRENLTAQCYAVDLEADGEAGSYLARTNEYDLIILDNFLPGKEGRDVVRDLRKAGKATPIIMLTVESEVPKKVELLGLGADDYVTKPFSFGELLARIQAILRRPREVQSEVLAIGDLAVDIQKQAVTRAGKNVYLTRKEFQLLEYLMRNAGRVISRGQILEHVWDVNADPFSNTIETHILNLRRKVDKDERRKVIHTVPGRGYKVDIRR